jgi:hypothetical protein
MIPFVVLAVLGFLINAIYSISFFLIGGWLCIVCIVFFFCASILITLFEITDQLERFEGVRESIQKELILREKRDLLMKVFKENITHYTNLEESIFKSLVPEKIEIFLAKYPELKSSEVIQKLVSKIETSQQTVFTEMVKRNKIIKKIWVTKNSPWSFKKYIPKYPEDIKDILTYKPEAKKEIVK